MLVVPGVLRDWDHNQAGELCPQQGVRQSSAQSGPLSCQKQLSSCAGLVSQHNRQKCSCCQTVQLPQTQLLSRVSKHRVNHPIPRVFFR